MQQLGDRGDTLFSPDEVENEQNSVDRFVDAMGIDVNEQRKRIAAAIVRGFEQFWNEWKTFKSQRSGWAAKHERSTYEKTLEFRERATTWWTKLKAAGVKLTAPMLPAATQGGGPGVNKTLMWVGVGAIALVGLFVLGKLVHTVVLGDAALTAAEHEALRIADEQRRKKQARRDRSVVSIA